MKFAYKMLLLLMAVLTVSAIAFAGDKDRLRALLAMPDEADLVQALRLPAALPPLSPATRQHRT